MKPESEQVRSPASHPRVIALFPAIRGGSLRPFLTDQNKTLQHPLWTVFEELPNETQHPNLHAAPAWEIPATPDVYC